MPTNFGRRVLLQIDDELFEGLKVGFNVTKTVKSSPRNKAQLELVNVSEEAAEKFMDRRRELTVRLYAGYEVPALVFTGNPIKNGVRFVWDGPDRVLSIEAQDGYRAYQRARVAGTFDADNVTLEDLALEAARQMGLPAGVIDIPGDARLTRGVTTFGPASRLLDRIAASTGADWSIQNGALQILPKNKVRRRSGPLFSDKLRNILERPQFTDEGLRLVSFLTPSLEPGDRFKVETGSRRYDGVYKALTVQHQGDLWGEDWSTTIEARPWKEEAVAEPTPLGFTRELPETEEERRLREVLEAGKNLWRK